MIKGNEYQGKLVVGQRVHSILYGGRDGIISAIHGEQSPESIRTLGGGCVVMGGRATVDVVFEEYISRALPESIIRGVQWFISDTIVDSDMINQGIDTAHQAMSAKKEAERLEALGKANERQGLPAKYPYLIPETKEVGGYVVGAKNIRIELKRAFPSVKFSVRSESYSGGCSIHIGWTDGPTEEEVRKISDKYQECDFDGMQDLEEYRRSVWPDVFGGAKYVSESRHESPDFILKISKKMGYDLPTGDHDNSGCLSGLNWEDSQRIYREARQTSCVSVEEKVNSKIQDMSQSLKNMANGTKKVDAVLAQILGK